MKTSNISTKTDKWNEERKNLLRQNYFSSQTNFVLCLDITKIGKNHSLFCALDLAARNIVGHCFIENNMKVVDVIETLTKILKDRDFLPKVQIIHSDRESLFKNEAYYEFLNQHNISASRSSAKAHENKVIERSFRTLKDIIKKKLNIDLKSKEILVNHFENFSEKAHFIKHVIEFYNNKPHKALYEMTPNNMEEALFCQNQATDIIDNHLVPALAKNDKGELANKITIFRKTVIQEYLESYIEDSKKFLISFRNETMNHLAVILKQNYTLYQQNLDLKKQMDFVESEMKVMKDKRLLKEQRALKRKNATNQKLRDSVNEKEFQGILELVKQNHFVASRRKTAFLLLYVTGLRVSTLLKFKIKHVQDLLNQGETQKPLIKRGG